LDSPKEPRAGNGAAEAAAQATTGKATPASSDAPQTKSDQRAHPAIVYIKGLSALCVVLALILILGYVLKRYGKKNALFAAPSLGQPMGNVYLAPRVSVHFLRTGGKVLLIGVTQNAIARLAEFDAETFDHESFSNVPEKNAAPARNPADFLSQLKSHIYEIESGEKPTNGNALKTKPTAGADDDADIASLRNDIERLQKYLKENSSGEGN
jgi:flagellar biogenesis protein FliO